MIVPLPTPTVLRYLLVTVVVWACFKWAAWVLRADCQDYWSPPRYYLVDPTRFCYGVKGWHRDAHRKAQGGSFIYSIAIYFLRLFVDGVLRFEGYLYKYEYHFASIAIVGYFFKEYLSGWLEDYGWGGMGLSYINTALGLGLDGGDSEADLPDLDLVAPEEPQRQELNYTNGGTHVHGHGGEPSSSTSSSQCEGCREVRQAKEKPRPEGWLVFHKIYGVVPQEVLAAWRDEERSRARPSRATAAPSSSTLPPQPPPPPLPPPANSSSGGGASHRCCNGSSSVVKVHERRDTSHPRRLPPVRRPPAKEG